MVVRSLVFVVVFPREAPGEIWKSHKSIHSVKAGQGQPKLEIQVARENTSQRARLGRAGDRVTEERGL